MKEFPITTKKGKEYIPYDIIKPHEEQALKKSLWSDIRHISSQRRFVLVGSLCCSNRQQIPL